jgi:hypothetical protein
VVTQRTANPLPRAENRHSLHFPPRLSRAGSRGKICSPANSAQAIPAGWWRRAAAPCEARVARSARMRPHLVPQEKM